MDKSREGSIRGIVSKIQRDVSAAYADVKMPIIDVDAGAGAGAGAGGEGSSGNGGRVVPIVCTSSETSVGGSRLWSIILESTASSGMSSGGGVGSGGGDIEVQRQVKRDDILMNLSQSGVEG